MGRPLILVVAGVVGIVSLAFLPRETADVDQKIDSGILQNTGIKKDTEEVAVYKSVVIGGKAFRTTVSDTDELRERGLSGTVALADDEAMLFVFEKPDLYGFWMKDMLFPIDILWIGEDLKVVSFEKNVTPLTFPKVFYPKAPALYVLEFKAGALEALDVKEGDAVSF